MLISLNCLSDWNKPLLYLTGCILTLILYGIALAIYRLTLHPLAGFPGPKFSAATGWYEFFIDIFQGQRETFAFRIERMHQKYGPIVRVNPHELHVNDPDFFAKLYATGNAKRDKYPPAAAVLGMPTGIFGTEDHSLHRIRRGAIESLFSTKNVATHHDMLRSKVELLCEQFHTASLDGKPLDIRFGLLAYTTDCFEAHVFRESERMDLLKDSNKSAVWRDSIVALLHWTAVVRQFPWMISIAKSVPVWMLQRPFPEMAYVLSKFQDMCTYAGNAISEWDSGSSKEETSYLWQSILSSDLAPSDKSAWRMAEEAMTLLTASGDTGARTLTVAMYHLHANPQCLQRLREELKSVMPRASDDVEVKKLEALPWLSAVMEESLRISSLITSRQPVMAPDEMLQYDKWEIPPGTPVGMTLSALMMNDSVYSSPVTFSPERWLQSNPEAPRNRKYFYPFHRGHRMCVARNLALPEMYLCLAKLVRRFECELFDVVRERDIDHHRDCFLGEPRDDTKGVRVRVLKDLQDHDTS